MKQEFERLRVRLQELSAWSDLETFPLECEFRAPNTDWLPLEVGQEWPSRAFPVEMVFSAQVPSAWAGKPVWVRLDVGGEGLLSLDGKALGGLNPFHREYPLLEAATGAEVVALEVEAVPKGLFGSPVPHPRLEEARLFVPDLQVRALHTDLACALDAAQQVQPEVAQLLLDALSETFALVRLPRGPAQAYLEQLERSGWSGMTARLWEEWKLDGPGLALGPEHRASLEAARAHFAQRLEAIRRRYPPVGHLLMSGHAHIDLAWLWPVAETRRKVRRTFATVLQLMERYPELCFSQSSAQAYAWLEADDPQLFEEVKKRVQEGRWELVGGMWVEPDGNLLSGESWARQLLYGQGYFQRKFGRRAAVAWLPDTFGFAANLPQLLSQGGLPYFFTTKLGWNETNAFPHDLWQWEGLDGTRVLAHSFHNPNEGYNGRLEAKDLAGTWHNFKGKRHHPTSLYTFGYGDGGGGPSAEMLERYARYREFPGLPRAEIGPVEGFYEGVGGREADHRPSALPVWVGEMYLELHRATYTTQAELKRLNRRLEHVLVEAEAALVLAERAGLGAPAEAWEVLEGAWKALLLGQFHDVLPGSGVHSVPKDAQESLSQALAVAEGLRRRALERLSADVAAPHPEAAAKVVVWNLGSAPKPLRLEMNRPLEGPFRLVGPGGEEVPYQLADERVLAAAGLEVPPLGYVALGVLRGEPTPPAGEGGVAVLGTLLENAHLRVKVAQDGSLSLLFDKDHQRKVLAGRGNQLWAYTDLPRFWEAWDLDAGYGAEGQNLEAAQVQVLESGPVRAGIRVEYRLGASRLEQTYWLWAGSRRLEVETTAHWQERRTLLRALFPLAVRSHEAYYESAFGAVARPTHANTSWDAARFEVPALRWADLSEAGYGVSLLNDAKYGHSARGNVLGLSLLRGSVWPDPYADVGEHRFTYALYPHAGDWRAGTVAEAEALNAPLLAVPGGPGGQGAARGCFLRLETPHLCRSALKRAEDGEGYVLRLYEAHGARGEALLDLSPLKVSRVSRVNLLEEELEALSLEGGVLRLSYRPYEVISLRLRP
jgi:alpha-mannosidase